ncbi:uvrd/rep helicase [Bacillus sp. OxB-1]|uniref:ATP-dependent helicase n=1 Tax=Bacillus sp. (strain OxB-1) TaxID=98228 RepID=UPI0005821531|nr:ATP-dependent helicase [Bacillus sp. OxB-1]BAQ12050.1 uvrd/rep helicase [Bacillus sp. OxB-1]
MEDFFERKKRELNIDLNDVQRQAVLQTEGPLLLLACPGSGKTTTMIMRIGYLIEEKGAYPGRIKAVTFSRAAAREMAERFSRFFPDSPPVDFSTIHSLAFSIARNYLGKLGSGYELIEGAGKGRGAITKTGLLKQLYKELLRDDATEDELSSLSTFISALKNKMVPMEKWTAVEGPFKLAGKIALKYERYKSRDARQRLLDFDDLLLIGEEALRVDEAIAEQFRSRYDYVLTDESQDTSLVQHKIVEHLVAHHGNLCVVADDDQSIYTWRGADPSYLLDFRRVYPDAAILRMEQNYRSSKEIVETAASFIKCNTQRYPKEMRTENGGKGPILIQRLDDAKRQLEYITYELLNEKELGEVAILFRNNASSTLFVSELTRRGIPFYMKDADDRFFSHWILKDILNFMRLSYNTNRKDIFSQIVMKMNLFVSRNQVSRFLSAKTDRDVFDSFIEAVELKANQTEKLKEYQEVYRKIPDMRPAQVIRVIRYELEYEESLRSRSEKYGFRLDGLQGILDTLEEIASSCRTMVEFANRLQELEQAVQQAKYDPPENAVTLSTFHSAKGLEFRRVFMIDLVQGIIPSEEDATDTRMLEEARRLFYVGMTRAKERLELLSYQKSGNTRKSDSRFINEVKRILAGEPVPVAGRRKVAVQQERKSQGKSVNPPPLNPNGIRSREELTAGTDVLHRVFGQGVILKVDGEEIHIRFGNTSKKLSLEMVLERRLLEKAAQ